MTEENYTMTITFPFKPKIIQAYDAEYKTWCWMSGEKDKWELEVDKLEEESEENKAMIKMLKNFGASNEDIITQIQIFKEQDKNQEEQ